jgi:hypothetical protein
MKRIGDVEALGQRLPNVDPQIAKALRRTVEAEIRRMRWGKQGLVAYGQRCTELHYPIEDCQKAIARFLENYIRDYIRELGASSRQPWPRMPALIFVRMASISSVLLA